MDNITKNKELQSVLKDADTSAVTDSSDELTHDEQHEIARDNNGRFMPGQSGNPAGKPAGTKHRITLVRQAIESQIVDRLEVDVMDVLLKAIELAKAGDTQMIKLILDKSVSNKNEYHNDDNKGGGSNQIIINVSAVDPRESVKETKGEIIDHET